MTPYNRLSYLCGPDTEVGYEGKKMRVYGVEGFVRNPKIPQCYLVIEMAVPQVMWFKIRGEFSLYTTKAGWTEWVSKRPIDEGERLLLQKMLLCTKKDLAMIQEGGCIL